MDAALVGLAGTTVGAVTGFAGAWLAQRGQLRIQQEQRTHAERVRWLDDKKGLYRDLLITLYGWHDSLAAIGKGVDDGRLAEHRTAAHKWIVETSLVADDQVRTAVSDVHRALLRAEAAMVDRAGGGSGAGGDSAVGGGVPVLAGVEDRLADLEDALRAELAMPGRVGTRSSAGPRGLRRASRSPAVPGPPGA
ncbi:hypothetical protein [Streptomyces lavendofoliae]|uniref:hypothetical protein n=1 Tax=Streptomyces lavendofoliae TaxID=67314 RepID=UPI003D8ED0E5